MVEKTESGQPRKFEFLPLSLHIETVGGIATPLVLRGTPLPATRMQTFATASDNQVSVEVKVLMGESPLAAKNRLLGVFYLKDIPKAPRGFPGITIKFTVSEYYKVTATAALDNGQFRVETIIDDPQKYLTPVAIGKALATAEAEKTQDQKEVSVIEARLNANAAIAKAESQLSQSGLSGERERQINRCVAEVGLAIESGILERIHVATQKLQEMLDSQSSMNDILKDLFGPAPFSAPPSSKPSPRSSSTAKPKKPAVASTQLTSESDPARPSKNVTPGKIFGGGDFTLDSSLCFVLMPFEAKFQPVYEDHIKRVITEAGLSSQRADEIASTNLITWDIWERLNKARLVIADLTDRNPNVFYEVGLAHAISKEVILLTQSMGDIPFDLQSLRFIVYQYNPRGMVEFEKKLRLAITVVLQSS
jgi:hypothetical protein